MQVLQCANVLVVVLLETKYGGPFTRSSTEYQYNWIQLKDN